MRVFHIQYASNLFVHRNQSWKQAQNLLTPRKAPNLALLGNIGNPHSEKTKNFIRWCADNWNHVYCVPGPLELQNEDRLNGLFPNLPKNLTILDQTVKNIDSNLSLVGCPLLTAHAEQVNGFPQLSEFERFSLACKPPTQISYWHDEDKTFLRDNIRFLGNNYGPLRKMIILTHSVPSQYFIPANIPDRDRQIALQDGAYSGLLGEHILGALCGAGGGSITGTIRGTFCGVNAAFRNQDMIPNRQYRPDMTASFLIDPFPKPPENQQISTRISLPKFVPFPQLAVA
jgi:hypothetical protein